MCAACGTGEGQIHAPGCKVYLSKPEVMGENECTNCHGMVKYLVNGMCGVCRYWTEKRGLN